MKNQKQLVDKFQLEELEHRYEMAWISEVKVTGCVDGYCGSVTIPV